MFSFDIKLYLWHKNITHRVIIVFTPFWSEFGSSRMSFTSNFAHLHSYVITPVPLLKKLVNYPLKYIYKIFLGKLAQKRKFIKVRNEIKKGFFYCDLYSIIDVFRCFFCTSNFVNLQILNQLT